MKVCSCCGIEISTRDGENLCAGCEAKAADGKRLARNAKAKAARKERDAIMKSMGLKKVRGGLGGTYWE